MIKLTDAVKCFDDGFKALDGVNLEIPSGSAYGLLGSNGAGKSTILRILSGVYSLDGGTAEIDGESVYDNVKTKERVFFVNDETVQFNSFTLNELKGFYKLFYPKFSEEKFTELWDILKLPLNKKISTFSKGMKRQSAVICAIACQTDYVLLDEAFDGLDPTMRILVKKMLVDAMLDNKLTVVISSHNLKEIDEFCDSVGLLHKGKVIFNRELDSLKGNIHKVQTSFDAEYTAEDFPSLEILHFEKKGSVVYIIAKGESEEITRAINEKTPKILDVIPLSLEEIFLYEMEGQGYDFNLLK